MINTPEQKFTELTSKANREGGSPPDKPIIMYKRIGSTTYQVAVHFSQTSHETMGDKVNRIICREIESDGIE